MGAMRPLLTALVASLFFCAGAWAQTQGRSPLGFSYTNVPIDQLQALKLPRSEGVLVTALDPDGAAVKAGIRVGDVVTAYAEVPVMNSADMKDALQAAPAGAVPLRVWRDGEASAVSVAPAK
jgi:serine protease Do